MKERLHLCPTRLCLATTFLLVSTGPAGAAEVSGTVRVKGRVARAQIQTIVYAEPLDGPANPAPKTFKLLQRNKAFAPRILAVAAGSIVQFTNEDLIYHNVFSLSPPDPFDLGLYRAGASKTRTFREPATYRVFCNIHPQMTGVLLVLPTPYITETDASGNFRLDLPPGRYRITAWSERSKPVTTEATIGPDPVRLPDFSLDETNFVELPHKNKFGQDYPKSAYDPARDKKPQ